MASIRKRQSPPSARVGLIEEGGVGAVLVGRPGTPELVRLQGFLGRNGCPYTVLDSSTDAEARALLERSGMLPKDLPILVCPSGSLLKRPTDAEAGACLGITPKLDPEKVYDVVVVGAGPAGLRSSRRLRRGQLLLNPSLKLEIQFQDPAFALSVKLAASDWPVWTLVFTILRRIFRATSLSRKVHSRTVRCK